MNSLKLLLDVWSFDNNSPRNIAFDVLNFVSAKQDIRVKTRT